MQFEVIVADNGSSDGTVGIVEAFAAADHRVRLVDSTSVPSEALARNIAVGACTAPLVAFCDADDVVRPGWLAAIHAAMSSGAHAVNVTREQWSLNSGIREAGAPQTKISSWVAGGAFAVRRGLFLQLGGFDVSLPTAADTEFGFRLFDRMGRHPQAVPEAVVSVRLPKDIGAIFTRARRLSRVRHRLRLQHPNHLSAQISDVMGFRLRLLGTLAADLPKLAGPARAGWVEVAGTLVGELEGSVVAALPNRDRRR